MTFGVSKTETQKQTIFLIDRLWINILKSDIELFKTLEALFPLKMRHISQAVKELRKYLRKLGQKL